VGVPGERALGGRGPALHGTMPCHPNSPAGVSGPRVGSAHTRRPPQASRHPPHGARLTPSSRVAERIPNLVCALNAIL
jgi:hypothetical protein